MGKFAFRPVTVVPDPDTGTDPLVAPAVFGDDVVYDPAPAFGGPGSHAAVAVVVHNVVGDVHIGLTGSNYPPTEVVMHQAATRDDPGSAKRPDPFPVAGNLVAVGHAGSIPGYPDADSPSIFDEAIGDCGRRPPIERHAVPAVVDNVTVFDNDLGSFAAEDATDAHHDGVNSVVVVTNIDILHVHARTSHDNAGVGGVAVGITPAAGDGQVEYL